MIIIMSPNDEAINNSKRLLETNYKNHAIADVNYTFIDGTNLKTEKNKSEVKDLYFTGHGCVGTFADQNPKKFFKNLEDKIEEAKQIYPNFEIANIYLDGCQIGNVNTLKKESSDKRVCFAEQVAKLINKKYPNTQVYAFSNVDNDNINIIISDCDGDYIISNGISAANANIFRDQFDQHTNAKTHLETLKHNLQQVKNKKNQWLSDYKINEHTLSEEDKEKFLLLIGNLDDQISDFNQEIVVTNDIILELDKQINKLKVPLSKQITDPMQYFKDNQKQCNFTARVKQAQTLLNQETTLAKPAQSTVQEVSKTVTVTAKMPKSVQTPQQEAEYLRKQTEQAELKRKLKEGTISTKPVSIPAKVVAPITIGMQKKPTVQEVAKTAIGTKEIAKGAQTAEQKRAEQAEYKRKLKEQLAADAQKETNTQPKGP